jgi:hypothetical protein
MVGTRRFQAMGQPTAFNLRSPTVRRPPLHPLPKDRRGVQRGAQRRVELRRREQPRLDAFEGHGGEGAQLGAHSSR